MIYLWVYGLIDLIEEKQRLAEAVKHHQASHSSVSDQPEGKSTIHLLRANLVSVANTVLRTS